MFRRALERDPQGAWELELWPTAEQGLGWLREHSLPDVVVADLMLPGMDGLALLQEVRRKYGSPQPAVVLLTGAGSEQCAAQAIKTGAQDYLVKDGLTAERLRHGLRAAVESARLQAALEAHRVRVEHAEQEAREALTVRDELFALATHDLKGPLQNILLVARLMLRRLPALLPATEQQEHLEQIVRSARRMGELINHFLEATRGGECALHCKPMNLLELVQCKVHELAPVAAERPLHLRVKGVDFDGVWDGEALERVLDNLLSNSLKYGAPGTPITLWLEEEPGQVELRVEDLGPGIPEGDLPFIFERFHRGSNTLQGPPGSGVGLASTLRLVELHGGTVGVQSRQGQGSLFTVRLPRQPPQQEEAKPVAPPRATGCCKAAEQGR